MHHDPPLIDGTIYNITFAFTDKAGNVGTKTIHNVTYDTTIPDIKPGSISFTNNLNNTNWAKPGDTIKLIFETTEPVNAPGASGGVAVIFKSGGETYDHSSVLAFSNTSQISSNISGTIWTIKCNIAAGDSNGKIFYDISLSDCAGNINSKIGSSELKLDKTKPEITPISLTSSGGGGWAKKGEEVILTFNSNEPIKSPEVTFNILGGVELSKVFAENSDGNKTSWTAKYPVLETSNNGEVAFSIAFEDLAGNEGTPISGPVSGQGSVQIDTVLPVVTFTSLESSNSAVSEWAKETNTITLKFEHNDILPVAPIVTFRSGGQSFINSFEMGKDTNPTTDGNTYTATYIVNSDDTHDGLIFYKISSIEDRAGNQGVELEGNSTLKLDSTKPTIVDSSTVSYTHLTLPTN